MPKRKLGLEEWSELYNHPNVRFDYSKLAGVAKQRLAEQTAVRSDNTRTNVKARATQQAQNKARKQADISAERAVRKRQERRTNPAFDEQEDKAATEKAVNEATNNRNLVDNVVHYMPDVIDGAMAGASMIPGYGQLMGTTYFGTKGAKDISQGNYLSGALNLTPYAVAIGTNPATQNILRSTLTRKGWRDWLYLSKSPVGYNESGWIKNWVSNMLSGDRPNLNNPKWFNDKTASSLESYAPMYKEYWSGMNGVEGRNADLLKNYGMPTTTDLKDWARRALEVRDDQWRMRLGIAPRWGHLKKIGTENGMDVYTDPKGIEQLGYMPKIIEFRDPGDFINSSGGNVGHPKINWLGNGIAEKGAIGKKFGVAEINDVIDYHPFSRENDQIIARLQRHFKDPLGRNYSYLNKLNEKGKKIELASVFGKNILGAKPAFKMQYKIPFTQDYTSLTGDVLTTKGFNSTNTLPWQVEDYLTTGYDPHITENIINSIDFSKILKSNKSIKTK